MATTGVWGYLNTNEHLFGRFEVVGVGYRRRTRWASKPWLPVIPHIDGS